MKLKMILLVALVAVAAACFLIFSGQQKTQSEVLEGVSPFNGTPPFLNLTFEYPQDWKLSFSRAKRTEEATVQLIGPRDIEHQFSVSFAVIGTKKTDKGTLEAEAEKLVERNKALDQFKVVSKGAVQVAGQEGRRVVFDFVIPLPAGFLNAPPVTMREEVILISRGELLYQAYLIGTLEQHEQNKRHFERLLKSLRFTE